MIMNDNSWEFTRSEGDLGMPFSIYLKMMDITETSNTGALAQHRLNVTMMVAMIWRINNTKPSLKSIFPSRTLKHCPHCMPAAPWPGFIDQHSSIMVSEMAWSHVLSRRQRLGLEDERRRFTLHLRAVWPVWPPCDPCDLSQELSWKIIVYICLYDNTIIYYQHNHGLILLLSIY